MRDTNDSTRPKRHAVGTWLDKKGKIARTRVDNDRQSFPLQRQFGKMVVMHLVGILLISTFSLLGCAPDQEPVPDLGLPVPDLGLCEDDWEGEYCINTVGRSIEQQLISLKHSDSAETDVYLVVNGDSYYCRTVDAYPGNLYCSGPLLSSPLGAEVEIVTAAEELVLARGIVDFLILEPVPTKPSDDSGYY